MSTRNVETLDQILSRALTERELDHVLPRADRLEWERRQVRLAALRLSRATRAAWESNPTEENRAAYSAAVHAEIALYREADEEEAGR